MRLRPHLFTDSILPPLSAAACSTLAIILSMSSYGVSGPPMKIRSYWRSSMCPRFLISQRYRVSKNSNWHRASPLRGELRIFFGRLHAAIKFRHRLVDAFGHNQLDRVGRIRNHLARSLPFGPAQLTQDIIAQVAPNLFGLDAQSHPDKFACAERRDNGR